MKKNLVIATRSSQLALWQAEWAKAQINHHFPDVDIRLAHIKTKGDKILDAPLAKIGGKGLFVKELEVAILNGEADIAVHSMKDVPIAFPDGLEISVITKRAKHPMMLSYPTDTIPLISSPQMHWWGQVL